MTPERMVATPAYLLVFLTPGKHSPKRPYEGCVRIMPTVIELIDRSNPDHRHLP
jgi:hypothetical protein